MEPLKIKYSTLSSFEFQALMQKISNSSTSFTNASFIRRRVNAITKARDKMSEEFRKEIMEEFAKKDEAGKVIASPEKPYDVDEKDFEKYQEATNKFGERTALIDWTPFGDKNLSEVRMSAAEIELLGELYSDEPVGPGIPEMAQDHMGHNVHPLKK